jgi:hypothetical protein
MNDYSAEYNLSVRREFSQTKKRLMGLFISVMRIP